MSQDLRAQLQEALGTAYTIDRELGGGGMSRVFVARETSLGRDVVVKVLPPDLAGELSAERFRREIQLAARLQHPNIVPVHSAGSAGNILFYTMPFIEGESLRGRLQRSGELRVQDVVRMGRELADALAYAHERGVVHRDLKPENILITRGHALVADFGVAKAVTESVTAQGEAKSILTSVGLALGTPAYMAPEQAAGDPTVDHRADIYALGCVLYELLTGNPPFTGRPTQGLLAAHIAEIPDAVVRRRPATPGPLSALVMSMLEKRPADRPQSADEIIGVLDTIGASGTVSADTVIASQQTSAVAQSKVGWRIGIAAGILAGIALVAVVATNLASRKSPAADPSAPIAIAIIDAEPGKKTEKISVAEKSVRDYLVDAVSSFDQARVVSDVAQARYAISTSSTPLGTDSLLLRARLIEPSSEKVLRTFTPARLPISDPTSGLEPLKGRVHAAIGIVLHPMLGPAALPGTDTPTAESFAEFSAALVSIDRLLSGATLDRNAIAASLEKSHALDSSFVQPLLWLGFVKIPGLTARRMGDSITTTAAQKHSGRMTAYERNLAELFHLSLIGDIASSVRVSEALYRETPVEWTAQAHARSLSQVARYRGAVRILDSLSEFATADDPQFWADYVRVLHVLGDHTRELEIARRARKLMPERRGVRNFEVAALIALDSGDAALRAMEEALVLPAERDAGNAPLSSPATAVGEFRAHGNETYARKVEQRAAPILSRLTFEDGGQSIAALLQLGDYRHALDFALKARERNSANTVLSPTVGIASAALGDTAAATREMERIEKDAAALRPYTNGADLAARARIAAALGRDDEAILLASQAIAQGQGFTMRRLIHAAREFRHLKGNPEIQKLMKAREN
jgi:serine/threonine-protein kinase